MTHQPGPLAARHSNSFFRFPKQALRTAHNPQPQLPSLSPPSPCLRASVRDHFFDRTTHLTCLVRSVQLTSKSCRHPNEALPTAHNPQPQFPSLSPPSPCLRASVRDPFFHRTTTPNCLVRSVQLTSKSCGLPKQALRTAHNPQPQFPSLSHPPPCLCG